jgi:glycosyltransferase involved in cell wall biosynthesis
MDEIVNQVPNAALVVAGTNHPRAPGYLESLQQRWLGRDHVSFRGYVAEEELPALFAAASVLVLPYSSTAGASGVVYQACQYGLPMVAADIPEIVDIAQEEGIAIEFYSRGDGHALASQLIRVLTSDKLRRGMCSQNLQAAQKIPMSQVTDGYLRLFRERVFASHVEVKIS